MAVFKPNDFIVNIILFFFKKIIIIVQTQFFVFSWLFDSADPNFDHISD